MLRLSRSILGLVPLLPVAALVASCSQGASRIGLVMESPLGLLDSATGVKLNVFAANQAKCLATGHVTKIPTGEGTQTYSLSQSGCEPGVAWCKDIELDKDDSDKMFAIVATGTNDEVIAEGCATAKIDQDPLEVAIKVTRYNPPPCCNDGKVQATEQCDPGSVAPTDCSGVPNTGGACKGIVADSVCDCFCRAAEIPIDHQGDAIPPPFVHVGLSMAFCSGSGQLDKALRAAFTDQAKPLSKDVMVRALKQDLYAIDNPLSLAAPLPIPVGCDGKEAGSLGAQKEPSIAAVSKTATAVVYLSDEPPNVGGLFQVYLSHQSEDGCKADNPHQVNAKPIPAAPTVSASPDVAGGPKELGLVVWTASGAGLARIWDSKVSGADSFLPADADIPIAANASRLRVAGSDQGWAVVYAGSGDGDGDGIFLVHVDVNGKPAAPVKVNGITDGPQDQPDVAMLPDGTVMVVWHSALDVFFQRFAPDGAPVAGDQSAPIHLASAGDQVNPAVAASTDVGDFFVAAWETAETGTISARYVGGATGFLFNSVTGQNDDFLASHPDYLGPARTPAVAIGGGGFVAIGWQDDDPNHAGVYVRRFPLPQ